MNPREQKPEEEEEEEEEEQLEDRRGRRCEQWPVVFRAPLTLEGLSSRGSCRRIGPGFRSEYIRSGRRIERRIT